LRCETSAALVRRRLPVAKAVESSDLRQKIALVVATIVEQWFGAELDTSFVSADTREAGCQVGRARFIALL
jgi:hypothetical protein